MFGRSKFQGYVVARRRSTDDRTAQIEEEAIETVAPYRVPESERPEATRAADGLAEMPVLRGNRVDLPIDGDATFKSILDGIDAAQECVLVQFYIVHDDGLGRALKDHLLAKAKEGVRVYFLYDEIGCHDLPRSYTGDLRDAGLEIHEFNTRKGRRNRFQLNFRNHRKIVVADGRVAWIGGHNVGDEYLGKDPKFGHWRDTHVRIEGPAVLKAQISFAEDWYWATETLPKLNWAARPDPDGSDSRVLIMPTGPADELETANLMFVHAINTAQERIWIASPSASFRDHRSHCRCGFRLPGRADVRGRFQASTADEAGRVRPKAMVVPARRPHRSSDSPHTIKGDSPLFTWTRFRRRAAGPSDRDDRCVRSPTRGPSRPSPRVRVRPVRFGRAGR